MEQAGFPLEKGFLTSKELSVGNGAEVYGACPPLLEHGAPSLSSRLCAGPGLGSAWEHGQGLGQLADGPLG